MSKTENKFADVPIRIKGWGYIIIVFLMAIASEFLMSVFIAWVSFQALWEFSKMFLFKEKYLILQIGLPLFQWFLLLFFPLYEKYIIGAIFLGLLTILYIHFSRKENSKKKIMLLSIVIVLFTFPHLFFIRSADNGLYLLVFLVVITEMNDIFQYLCGKIFGKHKILPSISSNKTLEGFLGGMLLTMIFSIILGQFLFPKVPILSLVFIGLCLNCFGFLGDIFVSFLKRKAKVKDTGNLIVGHGGLLDRMDSLLLNSVLFYHGIKYIF